jgi:hypothetical protein
VTRKQCQCAGGWKGDLYNGRTSIRSTALFGFRRFPYGEELFNGHDNGQALAQDKDTGAVLGCNKVGEMLRHCAAIVRNQNASLSSGRRQDFRVLKTAQTCLGSGLEINHALVSPPPSRCFDLNRHPPEIGFSSLSGHSRDYEEGVSFCCLCAISF